MSTTSTSSAPVQGSAASGVWAEKSGHFKRQASSFRDFVSREPGARFAPEKGRYHLYVSLACPWAHRTLITRKLKGLEDIISVNVVDWFMGPDGWRFPESATAVPGSTLDELYGSKMIREIYLKADPEYAARFTVPVLWDKKLQTIVNNESAEIIRMFYTEFDDLVAPEFRGVTYYPEKHAKAIDGINDWVYNDINNGVYKSGFATTQEAYDTNVVQLFKSLDRVEALLAASDGPYLLGKDFTEADLRLYPTIVRFDPVYVQHFKCNIGMIRFNYPHIHTWLRHLYWDIPAFKETTNFDHIKFHYTKSHVKYNPFGITPAGPLPNINAKDE